MAIRADLSSQAACAIRHGAPYERLEATLGQPRFVLNGRAALGWVEEAALPRGGDEEMVRELVGRLGGLYAPGRRAQATGRGRGERGSSSPGSRRKVDCGVCRPCALRRSCWRREGTWGLCQAWPIRRRRYIPSGVCPTPPREPAGSGCGPFVLRVLLVEGAHAQD